MDKRLRIALLSVFSLIFVVSAVMLIHEGIEYKKNEEVYNQAQEVAGLPNMDDIGATLKPIGTGEMPSATDLVANVNSEIPGSGSLWLYVLGGSALLVSVVSLSALAFVLIRKKHN